LDTLVVQIITRINSGIDCIIFCQGGHGRTGYIAASVLGALGIEDPIAEIRKTCKDMIESSEQINSIADYLGKPDLKTKHKVYLKDWDYGYNSFYRSYPAPHNPPLTIYKTCKVCGNVFNGSICTFCGEELNKPIKTCGTCRFGRKMSKICEYCDNFNCHVEDDLPEEDICGDECEFFDLHTGVCLINNRTMKEGDKCVCQVEKHEFEDIAEEEARDAGWR